MGRIVHVGGHGSVIQMGRIVGSTGWVVQMGRIVGDPV